MRLLDINLGTKSKDAEKWDCGSSEECPMTQTPLKLSKLDSLNDVVLSDPYLRWLIYPCYVKGSCIHLDKSVSIEWSNSTEAGIGSLAKFQEIVFGLREALDLAAELPGTRNGHDSCSKGVPFG
ncbi:hypothetical protein GH714_019887 [Hevea brasiliensis]|uniref:Uncharacterized protein n=1 Tax=Hevea brasiliensis TaxID=3981 RepID=A0A6A6K5X9_HEVBR|nr:hypothetical protein GH714_019887 [Hevea brasiliensis]